MDNLLHVGRPNLGDRDHFNELVDGMFSRRWFSNNGELVQQLEAKIADFLDVDHCILVCNATVGLQIACHALELTGEVIVPAYTFVATAHAVQWEGLRPVFVDVDLRTHTIDVAQIEDRITDQTSAIVGVHVWGNPCDTLEIDRIAKQRGLRVMYDAAHAFGCRHSGEMIGNFGDCEIFSFHATKFFNTFEGGAITTNDAILAKKLRLMKNFGFSGMDNVIHLGTNGKMPEVCAAMGLACFEKLDEILEVNKRNYTIYREYLRGKEGLRLLDYEGHEGINYQYVVLEIDSSFRVTRDEVVEFLASNGVRARRYFYPGLHRMEPYRTLYPDELKRLPKTDELCSKVICLPTGTAVSIEDVKRVCGLITQLAARS